MGFKRFFKGSIVAEVYTPLDKLDFAAELAGSACGGPAAVYAWYPGGQGIQYVRQYAQAGLLGKIPLYSAEMIDDTTLTALGDAALGITTVASGQPTCPMPRTAASSTISSPNTGAAPRPTPRPRVPAR